MLPQKDDKRTSWTPEEDEIIRTIYPKMGCTKQFMYLLPNRTIYAIRNRIHDLNVHIHDDILLSNARKKSLEKWADPEYAKHVVDAIKEALKGRPAWNRGIPHTEETKKKKSNAGKGRKLPPRSEEYRKKQSESQKGKKRSPEAIEKTRKANTGKKRTPETIEKMRQARTGKHSSEHWIITICKECGKEFGYYASRGQTIYCSRKCTSEARIGSKISEEHKKKIGDANRNPSEETRRKKSDASKGRDMSKLQELARLANIGRKISEKTRKKMIEAHKNIIRTKEWNEKIGRANIGRKASESTLIKMRIASLGRKVSDETKKKISEAGKGRKHSEESKKKIGYAHLRENLTEETLKRYSDASIKRVGTYPSRDTKIEKKIQKMLVDEFNRTKDVDFFIEYNVDMICKADIVLPKEKIVIMCDGDYWHGYKYINLSNDEIEKIPKIGKQIISILEAINRDRHINIKLQEAGYVVLRFWEHEINKESNKIKEKIKQAIESYNILEKNI